MSSALGNIRLICVAYQAAKALSPVMRKLLAATNKDFLAVQIVNRLIHIQGRISGNYRGFLGSLKFNQKKGKGVSDDQQY